MKEKYYSTTEAGQKLGVTKQRIHQLMKSGKLPYEKIGKVHIVSEESIKYYKQQKEK